MQCSNLEDDQPTDPVDPDCEPSRRKSDHESIPLLQPSPLSVAGHLFGAWVHSTVITLTAILIGLFIELRFHDAWPLFVL